METTGWLADPPPQPQAPHRRPLYTPRLARISPRPRRNTMPPTAADIRQQFIDFFVEKHGHTFVPSSPVVPHDDPTLLFANAGMNQFKPILPRDRRSPTKRADWTRAANTQKCIRAGGKHNDLDDVGKDTYHHTFFEMLGNWSFGDYFKRRKRSPGPGNCSPRSGASTPKRLLRDVLRGRPERRVSNPTSRPRTSGCNYLPEDRVLPGDMKDNFWEMGDTGPCGPCSARSTTTDSPDYSERAQLAGHNLVNKDHEHRHRALEPRLHPVRSLRPPGATGSSPSPPSTSTPAWASSASCAPSRARPVQLRRPTSSPRSLQKIQERDRVFKRAVRRSGLNTFDDPIDTAYRVIADHIRTLTFPITDGADHFGNEGPRTTVLRRDPPARRPLRASERSAPPRRSSSPTSSRPSSKRWAASFPELKQELRSAIDGRHLATRKRSTFGRTLEQRHRRTSVRQHRRGLEVRRRAKPGTDAFKLHDDLRLPHRR